MSFRLSSQQNVQLVWTTWVLVFLKSREGTGEHMGAATTRDTDSHDPKQRTPDSIPAKSCQGLQKHRMASGYFVMNEELVGFPCLRAHSGVRFISLSTEPNTLQFVQW